MCPSVGGLQILINGVLYNLQSDSIYKKVQYIIIYVLIQLMHSEQFRNISYSRLLNSACVKAKASIILQFTRI
jgi:hypothetical protein